MIKILRIHQDNEYEINIFYCYHNTIVIINICKIMKSKNLLSLSQNLRLFYKTV